MIDAKNFRLGNIAASGGGIPFEVVYLDKDLPLRGVPITKDYLEQMGFIPQENSMLGMNLQTHVLELMGDSGDAWYPIYTEFAELSHEGEQFVFLNRIHFVHEVQNLVFVLAAKEITITIV